MRQPELALTFAIVGRNEIVPIALRLSDDAFCIPPVTANEKPRELYFSGRLIELDAAKPTFAIRNGKKELVFTIEPQRRDITVDGSMTERNLRFARIGDALMGELSLKEAKPYVT